MHTDEATSHAKLAEHSSKLGDHHSAAAEDMDEDDPTGAQHQRAMSECCKAMASEHVTAGQRHLDCLKAVDSMKAEDVGNEGGALKAIEDKLDKLLGSGIPSGVSAVPFFDSPDFVPRNGAPQNQQERDFAKSAKDKVSPQLADVLFGEQARG